MKKILTLMFAVGCMTAAMAQKHQEDYGRNDKRNDHRYDNYNNNLRERDAQIARINFQFNSRIRDINNDRYLRSNQKRKIVKSLEKERAGQIAAVYARYNAAPYNKGRDYAYGRH